MRIVVEHRFPPRVEMDVDAFRAASGADAHRIRSFVSTNSERAASFYDAASVDHVRAAVEALGGETRIWAAHPLGAPTESASGSGRVLCVVQRVWDPPTTREAQSARRHAASGCLERYRVRPVSSHVAFDGTRQLCTFEGPDAESVRGMSRAAGDPFERVWVARAIID